MLLRRNAGWLFALLIFVSGCTTVAMNAGFDDVRGTVEERSAIKIFWNNDTGLDKEAADKVDALLRAKLSVDEAVQVALLHNRDLQAIYSDLGVAQADLVQAGLFNDPILDAAVKFPTSGGQANLELVTVMNFLDVFYMPLRKRVAAARFEEAKLRVTGAVLDFAARARTAFYFHVANEQILELRQTIVQALNASLEVARRLNEAGNITDLDLARERALAEAGKLALRSAEIAVRQSREQLNDLMGLWGKNTEWQTDGRLPDISAQPMETEDIERAALSRSIDLSHARQRILVAGEQLGFNRTTALIPELNLGPFAERNKGAWEVGPVLEFPIPLFDQGQARIGRAAADLRRTQQDAWRCESARRRARSAIEWKDSAIALCTIATSVALA